MEDDFSRLSINIDVELEIIYDIFYGEEVIMFGLDFVRLVRMWQDCWVKVGIFFFVLYCVLLGYEV